MEKDLRDAYKALSLLRADLVATRKSKSDLQDQWREFVAQQRAQDAQRGAQLAQIRETFLMREEDFHAQLRHAEERYHEQQQHALLKNAMLLQELTQSREKEEKKPSPNQKSNSEYQPEDEEDNQQQHHHCRERKPEAEKTTVVGKEDGDAHGQEDASAESIMTDKLDLLASVYSLKQQVQTQADQLIQQDVAFTQDRTEWGLQIEQLKLEIAQFQESKRDFEREKKFMDEKFEFLRTEVDVVKAEREALREQVQWWEANADASAATKAATTVPDQVDQETDQLKADEELHKLRLKMEQCTKQIAELLAAQQLQQLQAQEMADQARQAEELKLQMEAQHKHEREAVDKAFADEKQQLREQLRQSNDRVHSHKTRAEELELLVETLRQEIESKQTQLVVVVNERCELEKQLQIIRDHAQHQLQVHAEQEDARMKTQLSEREKLQHELTTLLASFEAATAENAVKMEDLQLTNETLQRLLSEKTRKQAETQGCVENALQQLRRMQQVVEMQRDGLEKCREEVHTQRCLVVEYQQELQREVEQLQKELLTRVSHVLETRAHTSQLERSALEQRLVSCEQERACLDEQLRASQDTAQTLQQQLHGAQAARAFLQQQVEGNEARLVELELVLNAKDKELLLLRSEQDAAEQQAATEREALHVETQRLETELRLAQTSSYALQDQHERLTAQARGLEQQLMAAEDHGIDHSHSGATKSSSWAELATQIHVLDDFLPQLQLFAGRLHTCFQLCGENARAMKLLSATASPSLLTDLETLRLLVDSWRELFEQQDLALHVRLVRRSVLATLAQWFEDGDDTANGLKSPIPPPPFEIDSQEVAIVLQNWTDDLDKRRSVAQWLKRITAQTTETKNGDDDGAEEDGEESSSTLELTEMTREVKDAFCMLIVPLLKQNRRALVRVFTRRVCDVKSSYSPEETSWEMRIHVQFPVSQSPSQRRLGTGAAQHEQLRRVSSSSSMSSVASSASVGSSTASSLSLSSIASSSKLQMIHARLQQMQQQQH